MRFFLAAESRKDAAGGLDFVEVVVDLRGEHVQVVLAELTHALQQHGLQVRVGHETEALLLELPDLVHHATDQPEEHNKRVLVTEKEKHRSAPHADKERKLFIAWKGNFTVHTPCFHKYFLSNHAEIVLNARVHVLDLVPADHAVGECEAADLLLLHVQQKEQHARDGRSAPLLVRRQAHAVAFQKHLPNDHKSL